MRRKPFLIAIPHRSKEIFISTGSPAYEDLVVKLNLGSVEVPGQIPVGYSHRPDLIANLFYDSSENWWIFMEANGIKYPFEELNVDDIVGFPKQ